MTPLAEPSSTGRDVASWRFPDLRTLAAPGAAPAGPTAEEAAYERGWEAGREALLADHERSLAARLQTLAAIERSLADAAALLEQRFTSSVHALAVGIARHVIGAEFVADPTLLHGLVARAISLASLGGPLTLHLHPEDLESVRDATGVRDRPEGSVELRWVADPSVLRGGCVIEGPTSVVDGRIDRILLDIYERLASE